MSRRSCLPTWVGYCVVAVKVTVLLLLLALAGNFASALLLTSAIPATPQEERHATTLDQLTRIDEKLDILNESLVATTNALPAE